MKKESQVVMLPTEKASDLLLCIKDYTEHINTPAENSDVKGNFRLGYGKYANREFYQPQHLYFLSDDEIKEGDWYLCPNNTVKKCKRFSTGKALIFDIDEKADYTSDCKKIIATTDESLVQLIPNTIIGKAPVSLPRPSNEFLKKFCELGGVDKVLVEYEKVTVGWLDALKGKPNYSYKLKVAPDNTITIYPIEL